jgi:G:T-mismatch repair DNA endonuclease (very short patch repair protein)
MNEIIEKTNDFELTLPERIAIILHNQSPICNRGNKRKFKNFKVGFVNCGISSKCECTRESVSKSCKAKITNRDKKIQKEINDKRMTTVLATYGVKNVSNANEVKYKRKQTFIDRYGVTTGLLIDNKKIEGMIAKYGVANAQHIPGIRQKTIQTNIERFGEIHPMLVKEIKEKSHINRNKIFLSERISKSKLSISFNALLTILPDHIIPNFLVKDYKGIHNQHSHYQYEWKCLKCGLIFLRTMSRIRKIRCPKCTPSQYKSQPERDIAEMIQSWGFEIESNNRTLIYPYEIDLLIHQKRIAIEYCGLYYHSEKNKSDTLQGKNSTYHLDKLERCIEKGYRLITIFSDEWLFQKHIIETRLRSILGVGEKGLGARSLRIEQIKWSDAKVFLDQFHIQGSGPPGSIRYGAFDKENKLCAVMTFGKTIRSNNELIRFATDGKLYPGIASRLMASYVRNYNPSLIESYADRRWSEGLLYEKLGFSLTNISRPSYYYTIDYEHREHKSHFRLDKLEKKFNITIDSNDHESSIMFNLGYDRIWDCGLLKYTWKPL